MVFKHECGGRAHTAGYKAMHGWNICICIRCGDVFYKWITKKMLGLIT